MPLTLISLRTGVIHEPLELRPIRMLSFASLTKLPLNKAGQLIGLLMTH